MKTCNRCKRELPLDKYYKGLNNQNWCKECRSEYHKKKNSNGLRAPTSKGKHKQNNLWTNYRIRIETYDEMCKSQGGLCAGCKKLPGERGLFVDHDHACCPGTRSCGKCVRGLLCNNCNSALGQVRDSIETLESLVKYLESARFRSK